VKNRTVKLGIVLVACSALLTVSRLRRQLVVARHRRQCQCDVLRIEAHGVRSRTSASLRCNGRPRRTRPRRRDDRPPTTDPPTTDRRRPTRRRRPRRRHDETPTTPTSPPRRLVVVPALGNQPWQWELDHPLDLTSHPIWGPTTRSRRIACAESGHLRHRRHHQPCVNGQRPARSGDHVVCYIEVARRDYYTPVKRAFRRPTTRSSRPPVTSEASSRATPSTTSTSRPRRSRHHRVHDQTTVCDKGFDRWRPTSTRSTPPAATGFTLTQADQEAT